MPEIGQTISHYAIVEKLGAGGMGEVYKARDTRLDRTVAIKTLKPAAAPSADLRLRFEREAKAIAALNHPHICTLFDVGREGDIDFLVIEYCEGETLAQRLTKGSLPLDLVLRYGTEIAGALDKAHRAGIVHRDLKPGNIMITRSGVKLLDFGLAKLRQTGAATGELLAQATATEPLTAAGTILGTLHYMAPEQLEGKDADARADIFALGTVLYEMVTGRRAFEGSSAASVISAVMSGAPKAIACLQPLTPPAFEQVVATCLAKDADERWQSAADVARQLRWFAEKPAPAKSQPVETQTHRHTGVFLWAAAAAILIFLAGAFLSYWLLKSPPVSKEPSRFKLTVPADAPLAQPRELLFGADRASLAISADGRRFCYVAMNNGRRKLYVRQLDEFDFRPLDGTEDGESPFFKPDGEWLGYYSAGKLRKAAFNGSSVSEICDVHFDFQGGTWSRDGWIFFADSGQLSRIPDEGGTAQVAFPRKWLSNSIGLPRLLPDGDSVLGTGSEIGDSVLLSLTSGTVRTVFESGGNPYLTSTGHLVASGQGALLAAPFDIKAGKITREYITVLDGLRTTNLWGAKYALSDNGTLFYALGGPSDEGRLVKVDRNSGAAQDLGFPPGIYQHVSMARDGVHVAVSKKEGARILVFTADLRQQPFWNRLASSEGRINNSPIWNSQGDKIAFCSDRGTQPGIWLQSMAGNSSPNQLQVGGKVGIPTDWSSDDHFLFFMGQGSGTNFTQKILDLTAKLQERDLSESSSNTFWGVLSPDGRWLAYGSDESGNGEIWIRSWPDLSAHRFRISSHGGGDPLWSRDGKELFYRNRDQFMAVPVPAAIESWVPRPRLMFSGNYLNVQNRPWDVMDDQHFIMIQPTHPDPPKTELYLIQNWFEELKRLVPIK